MDFDKFFFGKQILFDALLNYEHVQKLCFHFDNQKKIARGAQKCVREGGERGRERNKVSKYFSTIIVFSNAFYEWPHCFDDCQVFLLGFSVENFLFHFLSFLKEEKFEI